jgi:hypothetical protein
VTWLREKWAWIVAGLGLVVGAVLFILTFGRVRPKPPKIPDRPETPDVPLPPRADVDTTPADDYNEVKTEPEATTADDLVDAINRRHG